MTSPGFRKEKGARNLTLLGIVLGLSSAGLLSWPTPAAEPIPSVEWNRDIRPILSDTCFHCHGPDKAKRKAELRLDTEAGAFADLGGRHAIVAGKPDESELFRRITTTDHAQRMPPAKSGHRLSDHQIDLIRRWIAQGARWQKHWSFLPPNRPSLPPVKNAGWARNPIDLFILERLEREGLSLSAEADRVTLLRRVTLDLTGLPPTPAEVDAFLADASPDAYEKVVDRLLTSAHYGERMAIRWLDAARYADTSGYQSDGERFMYRWRDWVIEAFNGNMPFDQFTVEQLAGDMLPRATLDQKIATGFNRNHRGNAEGGIIPEEYAVEYVVDRVDTTATVWLGLTMGCARCHDHKYDPISQKEFYQVFAHFNNVPERGKAIKYGNSVPVIKSPTRDQQEELQQLEARLQAAEERYRKQRPQLAKRQAEWEKIPTPFVILDWTVTRNLLAHYRLDGPGAEEQAPRGAFKDGSPVFVEGRKGQAADFDGKRYLDAGDRGNFGFYDKFSLAAWIYPRGNEGGAIVSRMTDSARAEGYSLVLEKGKVQVNFVKRWLDDALRLETERALEPERWHHVLMTYDGSRVAGGVTVYVNGRPEKLRVNLDDLNQTFKTSEPLRIGAQGGTKGRFHGAIDDVRIYDDCLLPEEAEILSVVEAISDLLRIPAEKRAPAQAAKLRGYFLEYQAPPRIRKAHQELVELRRQRAQMIENFPTTMVMEELPTPRPAFVLIRGEYDKRGEPVTPGVPASIGSMPAELPNNRLGFARWLIHPSNPLTARVAVNRYWQIYFGAGLVKTPEDFGSQGEWPSHPELLDWLASEFVRTGWDVKQMQRLIVTSATYRQSSRMTPLLRQKDPENRLLARGPRYRLSAEMIRDQALAASGLLVERLGGLSVRPYQPDGLSRDLGADAYVQDHGEKLYRRSLYTFWKRTVTPPAMTAFDAPGREACMVRETRTNTPLQALNLMNDVTYVEAARVLAERVMKDATTPEQRLTLAFRLVMARLPRPAELTVLTGSLAHYRERYGKDGAAALKLVSVGESKRDEKLGVNELAAYTALASLILNLDEAITKE